MDWRNVVERCLWTFVEGFLVTITFTPELDRATLLAGIMAGLSAVKTVVIEYARMRGGGA